LILQTGDEYCQNHLVCQSENFKHNDFLIPVQHDLLEEIVEGEAESFIKKALLKFNVDIYSKSRTSNKRNSWCLI